MVIKPKTQLGSTSKDANIKTKTKNIFVLVTKNQQPTNAVRKLRQLSESSKPIGTPDETMDGDETAATAGDTAGHAGLNTTHLHFQHTHIQLCSVSLMRAGLSCCCGACSLVNRQSTATRGCPSNLLSLVKSNLCALRPTHASHT